MCAGRAAAARRRRRWRRAADASGGWQAVALGRGGRTVTVGHGRRQQPVAGVGSGGGRRVAGGSQTPVHSNCVCFLVIQTISICLVWSFFY